MKIHEYQAQALMREYGINVPDGYLAHNAEEAVAAAEKLDGGVYVLKAQIHSGGRGKAQSRWLSYRYARYTRYTLFQKPGANLPAQCRCRYP